MKNLYNFGSRCCIEIDKCKRFFLFYCKISIVIDLFLWVTYFFAELSVVWLACDKKFKRFWPSQDADCLLIFIQSVWHPSIRIVLFFWEIWRGLNLFVCLNNQGRNSKEIWHTIFCPNHGKLNQRYNWRSVVNLLNFPMKSTP
jgi:hypothetical protein